jgi:hypothetical protein
MKSTPLFWLWFLLFDGGALAFGVWQLWTVRTQRPKAPQDRAASDEGPGHAEGEHGLDDR